MHDPSSDNTENRFNSLKLDQQLCFVLYTTTNKITRLYNILEARGLITRQRETEDERRVTVHLTPAGFDLRERVLSVREEFICRIGVSETEADELRTALRKLIGYIKLEK